MQDRYSRQELFAGIGKEGQRKIAASCVAIVGCGALGSLQAEVMTRAGIGKLILIDRDYVEFSNLQRQSLFTETDAAQMAPKAMAAAARLREINSEVEIVPQFTDLVPDCASLLNPAQLVLDGTDNFQTRYLINDVAWKLGIPWIYGACVGSSGVAAAFVPERTACFRCVFEAEPPAGSAPTCDTAGIVWPAVGIVVSWQTTAALKLLMGVLPEPKLYQVDVWSDMMRAVSLAKAQKTDCPTCARREFPALKERAEFETTLCGRDAVQLRPRSARSVDLAAMQELWNKVGPTFRNSFLVKLQTGGFEIVLFADGRALIKGVPDATRARDLYARYVGV